MTSVSIPVSKIGSVIGPGGKTIRGIIEETGAQVDVQDDGTVFVSSVDGDASKRAVEMIENLTKEAKIGEIYTGKVVRILGFGAFVEILPGQDGMVHVSELSDHRVESVEDEIEMGQELTVQVIDIDPQGKISLSRRSLLLDEDMETVAARRQGAGGNGRPGGGGRGGPRDRGRDGGRPPRRDGPRRERDYGGGRPPRRRRPAWRPARTPVGAPTCNATCRGGSRTALAGRTPMTEQIRVAVQGALGRMGRENRRHAREGAGHAARGRRGQVRDG